MKNIHRQAWLNAYRIVSIAILVALLAGVGVLLSRSFMPVGTQELSKVAVATQMLESMGFTDPVYEGLQSYVEESHPTFEVGTPNGERVLVYIRTHPDGGYGVQPQGLFEEVSSADDFARAAQIAVLNWENMPSTISEGSSEWQSRKYNYDNLAKYSPSKDYWGEVDETTGWPTR